MKPLVLAVALALAAPLTATAAPAPAAKATPAAPAVDMPKPKCEPVPEYPGRLAMSVESKRKVFERDMKNYETCMKAFLEERKAVIKANENGANAAIEGYNAVMKKILEINEGLKIGSVRPPLPALEQSDLPQVEKCAKMVRDAVARCAG